MLDKIKTYIIAGLAGIAALLALMFTRESRKRKEAEADLGRQTAINTASENAGDAQREINAVVQESLKQPKKGGKKQGKILLPVIACFLFVACGKVEFVPVVSAPELFTFETGVELVLHEDMYCTDEDGALRIQKALQSYYDEIAVYNRWREGRK